MDPKIIPYFTPSILQKACARYQIKADDAKLIREFSNLIFDCGDKILRLSHSSIRSFSEVEAEIDWLHFLYQQGQPVVQTLLSTNEQLLEKIKCRETHFTAVCFEKIIGKRIDSAQWDEKHFQRLGKICGDFHRVGKAYQEKQHLTYHHWDQISEARLAQHLPKDDRQLSALQTQMETVIRQLPDRDYGLIHYDIHQGNYLLTPSNKIIVFDFELICKAWYVHDIAATMYYALNFPKKNWRGAADSDKIFLDNFMKGYEAVHSIDRTALGFIPYLLLYRDLVVYGFMTNVWKTNKMEQLDRDFKERMEASIAKRRKVLE